MIWFEVVHAVPQVLVGITPQHVERRIDMRIRIDHSKALSHGTLLYSYPLYSFYTRLPAGEGRGEGKPTP